MDLLSLGQQRDLLDRLLRLTRAGKLSWEAESDYRFYALLPSFDVRLYSVDRDDNPPFVLEIEVDTGTTLQVISTVVEPETDEDEVLNHLLANLYKGVKHAALGLEGAVDNLFNMLRDIEAGLVIERPRSSSSRGYDPGEEPF